jgi:hypothetical protein
VSSTDTFTEAELDELVSHVLALRKDYVQRLLKDHGVHFSGLRKPELRERLRDALHEQEISAYEVAQFLDEVEPGGKQHVFLMRARKALNDHWQDPAAVRRRLRARADVRAALDAPVPLLMPPELELSRIRLEDDLVEVIAIEARRYTERAEVYDEETTSEDGLKVELRGYIERVARSTVVLRWNTATRHAALHITQASGGNLGRDHYREVRERFSQTVAPWLDFAQFKDINLRPVVHELHRREQAAHPITRSRRGRFEMADGAEMEAISASTGVSIFGDERLKAAIGQVDDPASSQSGNLYWLPGGDGNILKSELHLSIQAFDSRLYFMVPSSPQEVEYVIGQIRSLL